MRRILLISVLFVSVLVADERPNAALGYSWKSFDRIHCDVQVPDGWFSDTTTAGITQVVRISPAPVVKGKGIDVGFTMNTIRCSTPRQWKEGLKLVGNFMAEAREAIERPIQSTVKEDKEMLVMIVEGERLLPLAPHPDKKYHVRVVVCAFREISTIYMYSFGAPTDEWDEAWKVGSVMLNPLWFNMRK